MDIDRAICGQLSTSCGQLPLTTLSGIMTCGWIMGARILALFEKDDQTRQVVICLRNVGYTVVVCQTFTEAITRLTGPRNIDLVISDVHLENGGNVFDFLRWVRNYAPPIAGLPFVLFSFQPSPLAKHLEDGVRTTARLLGAAHYIAMDTFDSDKFSKQIEELLPKTQKAARVPTKSENA